MKRIILFLLIFSVFSISSFGKVILPPVFADNMVLQQNSDVAIWGWSAPGETLKIVCSWNSNDIVIIKADNTSAWKTTIKTIGAGGPYSVSVSTTHPCPMFLAWKGFLWLLSVLIHGTNNS